MTDVKSFSEVTTMPSSTLITIDTSMMIAISDNNDTIKRRTCMKFFQDTARNDILLVPTVKAYEELLIYLTSQVAGADRVTRKKNLEDNPNLGSQIIARFNAVSTLFTKLPHVIMPPQGQINEQVIEQAKDLMVRCNLELGDAVTAVLAQQLGINAIACYDGDFLRLTETLLTIFVPDRIYNRYMANLKQTTINISH